MHPGHHGGGTFRPTSYLGLTLPPSSPLYTPSHGRQSSLSVSLSGAPSHSQLASPTFDYAPTSFGDDMSYQGPGLHDFGSMAGPSSALGNLPRVSPAGRAEDAPPGPQSELLAFLTNINSKLDTLLRADRYQALPIWVHDGYLGYDSSTVIAPKSAELRKKKAAHPGVQFWEQHEFTAAREVPTRGQAVRRGGGRHKKDDVNVEGLFCELSDGTVIGGREYGIVRETLNRFLADLLEAGLAKPRQSQLGEQVIGALIYMLERRFPFLGYCTYHWKALRVISQRYGHWARTRIQNGQLRDDGTAGEDDDDDLPAPPLGTKRKAAQPAGGPAKRAHLDDPMTDSNMLSMDNGPPPPPVVDNPVTTPPTPSALPTGAPSSLVPPQPQPAAEVDVLSSIVVPLPPPPPPPPAGGAPAVSGTTANVPATTKRPAGKSKKGLPCKPVPTHFTARNIYMVIYAEDVGGTLAEYNELWTKNIAPGIAKACETYIAELKAQTPKPTTIPTVDLIRRRIEELTAAVDGA